MGGCLLTYMDYGKPQEASHVEFPFPDLTVANIAAQSTLMDDLSAACDAVVLGVRVKEEHRITTSEVAYSQPSSSFCQRELKWLVRYHDAINGDKYSLEIPTADLAKLDPETNDQADMTDEDIMAFVAAFVALATVGPNNHAVLVDDILFVARNL